MPARRVYTVDPSFQSESILDQRIVSRIQAAVRNLANAKEQIQKEGIKGDTDDSLKRLLVGIVEKVEEQVEQILQEIAEITNEDIKISRSDRVHRNLEQFLFDLDLMGTATLQIPTELYYLTKASLRDLGHEDVKVVLIPEASLGTTNFSDALRELFVSFDNVLTYINSVFPFYWIILVPPSLIRTPLNWPLIAHEIGHILERQKWNLVKEYYRYPIVPSLSPPDIKSYYAQEFQADFVALLYFGPIFARRLLEIYYTREFMISKTHPSWRERFEAIADELEKAGFSTEATHLKEVSKKEEPSMIGRGSVEHLKNILSEIESKLSGSSCIYTQDDAEEKQAKRRLDRFVPYTDAIRTLLNVADSVLQSKLQAVSDPTDKRNVERDFDYLLVDSIRLNYIKHLVQPASLDCRSALS
jgi:hypothetical protein